MARFSNPLAQQLAQRQARAPQQFAQQPRIQNKPQVSAKGGNIRRPGGFKGGAQPVPPPRRAIF